MSAVCEHGSLRRSCEICERDERIAELQTCIRRLIKQEDPDAQRVRFDWARDILHGVANAAVSGGAERRTLDGLVGSSESKGE
jgi:hypothetical protein